jgi:hypothetical protein
MIHALIDTAKVVRTVELDGAPYEVCAEATANHDRRNNCLTVNLRSYLRAKQHEHLGETVNPVWLPAPQNVSEQVEFTEAHEMTNEIFLSWCRKVSESVQQ